MLSSIHRVSKPYYRFKIGNREVVGPAVGGLEDYIDRSDMPCPAVRFKPPSPEFDALRDKEKGSWKNMTIDEKKKLYRFNFCQTIKEVEAPNCEGRFIADSMSDQNKKQLVRWYIDSRADDMDGGISSKWDYEKNQWKEKPYFFMKSK